MLSVTFYHPFKEEVDHVDDFSLDDWRPWCDPSPNRRRAWIVQTYLRLSKAGYPVAISDKLPEEGIVVMLPERETRARFLGHENGSLRQLFLLTIRADIAGYREFFADAEVVQNGFFADERMSYWIPHWPQPALIPRSAARGSEIRTVAFKGRIGSLIDDFQSTEWQDSIEDVEFVVDTPHQSEFPRWHDYSNVDLLLAVRTDFGDGKFRCEKPASKLVNAWHAGVPALLGPEYAYRELRRSELDFIEVRSAVEAARAIAYLKDNPDVYRAMCDNARTRALEFTPDRIVDRWADVLFEQIPAARARRSARFSRVVPFRVRNVVTLVTEPPSPYEFRKMIGAMIRPAMDSVRNIFRNRAAQVRARDDSNTRPSDP